MYDGNWTTQSRKGDVSNMSSPDRKYYRIDDLPESIEQELRDAAGAAEVPVATAMSYILTGVDLPAAVIAGQLKLAQHAGQPAQAFGFHMSVELKDQLKVAARATGVKLGAVGRLVLIGKTGEIGRAIQDGMRSKMRAARAAAETPAAATQ